MLTKYHAVARKIKVRVYIKIPFDDLNRKL